MRPTRAHVLVLAVAAELAGLGCGPPRAAVTAPPTARTEPTTETVFGVRVDDPYRWMETGGAELETWLEAQGAHAEASLAAIGDRDALIAETARALTGSASQQRLEVRGDTWLLVDRPAGANYGRLVRAVDPRAGTIAAVVDPSAVSAGAAIETYMPSDDGALVAYNLSGGGDELAEIRVAEVATGAARPDVIPRIWGEFFARWHTDSQGFWYTQMALPGAYDDPLKGMVMKSHRLGADPATDVALVGPGINPSIAVEPTEFPLMWAASKSWVLMIVAGARVEHRVAYAPVAGLGPTTTWTTVAEYADSVEAADLHGDDLFLLRKHTTPNGEIARIRLPGGTPEVIVPESEVVITAFAVARDALYASGIAGSGSVLLRLPHGGAVQRIELPFPGAIEQLVADHARDGVFAQLSGWTRETGYFRHDGAAWHELPYGNRTELELVDLEVETADVPAEAGGLVPITIVRAKGTTGPRPTIANVYSAYGDTILPRFLGPYAPWLARGGVYVVVNARGSGARGRAWQVGGSGANKLVGVRDYLAVADWLAAKGVARPGQLAAWGGSMGAVLVGRALTLAPDKFGAAVIQVGFLNPLRLMHAQNGANQIGELGDPATEAGFRALHAMDPYQHLVRAAYPAVMLTVGMTDSRVAPWMSAKFAARLRAESTAGRPVLLRLDERGHAIGAEDETKARRLADAYAFLFAELK